MLSGVETSLRSFDFAALRKAMTEGRRREKTSVYRSASRVNRVRASRYRIVQWKAGVRTSQKFRATVERVRFPACTEGCRGNIPCWPFSLELSLPAAGGRGREGSITAAVEKSKEKRKPAAFFGHRKAESKNRFSFGQIEREMVLFLRRVWFANTKNDNARTHDRQRAADSRPYGGTGRRGRRPLRRPASPRLLKTKN